VRSLTLGVLPETLAVCRLANGAALPPLPATGFASITRTADERSVVCAEDAAPAGATVNGGWRAIVVRGPLAFELTGILVSVAAPLAEAGISIFAMSTYDTDTVLVKAELLPRALSVLRAAGHIVEEGS